MANTKRQREDRQRRMADAEAAMKDAPVRGGIKYLKVPANLPVWQPKEGAHEIDIIPFELKASSMRWTNNPDGATKGMWVPRRTVYVHYGIGPDAAAAVCSVKCFGDRDYVCDYRNKLSQDPDNTATRERWTKIIKPHMPKDRQLYLIWDHKQEEKGVQLYEDAYFNFGAQLDEKINDASEKVRPKYRKYWYPDVGLTLRVVAKKTPMGDSGKEFLKLAVHDLMDREKAVPDEIIDHGFCIDDFIIVEPYEQLKKIFHGGTPPDQENVQRNGRAVADGDLDDEEEDSGDKETDTDDDDMEEEEGEAEATDWKKGDEVTTEYKGKTYTGKIVKVDVDNELAHVAVKGRDRPLIVGLDDLNQLVDDPDDDDDPDDSDLDDTDDDDVPVKQTRGKAAKKGKEPEDDLDDLGDDLDDPEEEPAPKKRAGGAAKGRAAAPSDDDLDEFEDDPPAKPKRGRPGKK